LHPLGPTLLPYTTLFRSHGATRADDGPAHVSTVPREFDAPYDVVDEHQVTPLFAVAVDLDPAVVQRRPHEPGHEAVLVAHAGPVDRKSTRLNSSHVKISY